MKPARFHPEAEAELFAAVAYYEAQRTGLGAEFRREVEAALTMARQSPRMFPIRRGDGVRSCGVRRFPYAVYYLELDAEIWVAAVAHHRRRPGFWAGRAPGDLG